MKRAHPIRRWRRSLLLAAATMPLFATSCSSRSLSYLLGSDYFNNLFDTRSNAEKADDILNDIGDLFDSVF
ncbi:MAG TPA: hypothetical protein P5572_05020 [Phycisphaerae bacterium]|nr:hypothetical protein [Phycisphaerales bacterium]HRX84362.1 hypothetical protein [Phycisphaerae bacterium]